MAARLLHQGKHVPVDGVDTRIADPCEFIPALDNAAADIDDPLAVRRESLVAIIDLSHALVEIAADVIEHLVRGLKSGARSVKERRRTITAFGGTAMRTRHRDVGDVANDWIEINDIRQQRDVEGGDLIEIFDIGVTLVSDDSAIVVLANDAAGRARSRYIATRQRCRQIAHDPFGLALNREIDSFGERRFWLKGRMRTKNRRKEARVALLQLLHIGGIAVGCHHRSRADH